jgi:drug/metabolite transporter (DMT)-like permease
VLLLVTVLLWGFNFVTVKWALTHGLDPLVFATVQYGLGSAIFAGLAYGREGSLRVRRGDVWLVLGAAIVGIYLNQLSFTYAVKLTTVSTVALCFGTLPIFVALIARATGIERLHARHWLAVAVSFAGVAFVAAGSGAELSGDLGGILLTLGAALSWAAYSVVIGPLMRRYSPYRISAVTGIAASVALAATSGPQLASQDWGAITTLAWLALGYSMLFAFVLGYVLWFKAIGRVGAARSSLYANLQPFLGAIFAVLVLSETMSALQIGGGVVIALGILIAGLANRKA